MTMLTKIKYVGLDTADLIHIYFLYVRSLLEYCLVVWHSPLTKKQDHDIENVQKVCLKVILGREYPGYEDALKVCGLHKLSERRANKCLLFGLKSLLHPVHKSMFPVNPQILANPYNTSTSK